MIGGWKGRHFPERPEQLCVDCQVRSLYSWNLCFWQVSPFSCMGLMLEDSN
jgi:hypothetical protein